MVIPMCVSACASGWPTPWIESEGEQSAVCRNIYETRDGDRIVRPLDELVETGLNLDAAITAAGLGLPEADAHLEAIDVVVTVADSGC